MSNLYYVGEVSYKTVTIDGHEYQVPSVVAKELQRLDNTLDNEIEKSTATIEKLKKKANYEALADRIMINLAGGMAPLEPGVHFKRNESCLTHALNHWEKVDEASEPVFEFRNEVRRRIIYALEGKNRDGEEVK